MNNYMRKQSDDVAGAIVIIVAAPALLNLFLLQENDMHTSEEQEKFNKNVLRSSRFPRSAKEGLGSDYEPEEEPAGMVVVSVAVFVVLAVLFTWEILRYYG